MKREQKRMTKQQAQQMGLHTGVQIEYEYISQLEGISKSKKIKRKIGFVDQLYTFHFVVNWQDTNYKESFPYELLRGIQSERIRLKK